MYIGACVGASERTRAPLVVVVVVVTPNKLKVRTLNTSNHVCCQLFKFCTTMISRALRARII